MAKGKGGHLESGLAGLGHSEASVKAWIRSCGKFPSSGGCGEQGCLRAHFTCYAFYLGEGERVKG